MRFGFLSLFFIFIFFLLTPFLNSQVMSDNFCLSVKNVDCEKIGELSEQLDKIKKECDEHLFPWFSKKIDQCKKILDQEKKKRHKELKNIEIQEITTKKILKNINLNIQQLNIEIANLNLSINDLKKNIEERLKIIKELEEITLKQKNILKNLIRQLYEYESSPYTEVFLAYNSISSFTRKIIEVELLQERFQESIKELKETKQRIEQEKIELEREKETKIKYKNQKENSKESLKIKQNQKKHLLEKLAQAKTPLEKEIIRIETELIELKAAMEKIQKYLAQWVLVGQVTWPTIFSAVNRSSQVTGVRPALLLAILQIESRFGSRLGIPGKYLEYCNWSSIRGKIEAKTLEEICTSFGYDPNKVPMSVRCAIGPSQFLPNTWQSYQKLYKDLNNPWDLNDAVLATGYYLKRNGATTGNERGAVFVYNRSQVYVEAVMETAEAWQNVINICGLDLSCPQMKERLESRESFRQIPQ